MAKRLTLQEVVEQGRKGPTAQVTLTLVELARLRASCARHLADLKARQEFDPKGNSLRLALVEWRVILDKIIAAEAAALKTEAAPNG